MARTLNKLSDSQVKSEKNAGRHSDGGGLYLNVTAAGTKSWLFMWVAAGTKKRTEMGLGPYPTVSLAKARARAADCRLIVEEGGDPKAARDREAEPTFAACADKFIESIRSEWRNAKHEYQWRQTLGETYCSRLTQKRVSQITTEDVLAVLTPVWTVKAETASRLRGRLERLFEFAKVKGWRTGENPAAWRGNLRNLLPKRQRLQRGHQPALAYDDVPEFAKRLQKLDAMAARALEFTILTACRSGEVLGARWAEYDCRAATWTVPAWRMKHGQPHTVPLSKRAVEILDELALHKRGDFIFAGEPRSGNSDDATHGRPLSNMSMIMLLRRMKIADVTVHGFRSSFRDWAGDRTAFAREVAEEALSHLVGNSVERAYRRSTSVEKRRVLMQAWSDFVALSENDNVLTFARVQGGS